MAAVANVCEIVKVEFSFIYRFMLGATDFLTAAFLFAMLRRDRCPKIRVIVYLLAPVTFVLSSYHGNTDCLVPLFALASLKSLIVGSYPLAGFLLGLGISVKWIIVIAGPSLFFGIPTWQDRLRFTLFGALAIFVGYGWWLTQHPVIVFRSVFGYQGQMFFDGSGNPIWGNQILFRTGMRLLGIGDAEAQQLLDVLFRHNRVIVLVPILAYACLRRRRRAMREIGVTIAGCILHFLCGDELLGISIFCLGRSILFFP